jgi:hypothetical protein
MFLTPNMGLTAWDLGIDPYDHSQLANNFAAIDQHTHVPGQGKRIPTNGVEDLAITTSKIAADAVTPDKIPNASLTQQELAKPSVGNPELFDLSITNEKVANGTISAAKVNSTISFVGMLAHWVRVSAAVSPPVGWEVCDGRPWNTIPNAMGPGGTNWTTGNIPDFRGKYLIGAATIGTGVGPTQMPDIGQAVGSNIKDLSHTHVVNAHSHTVNAHTHIVDAHQHGGNTDAQGSHAHTFAGGFTMHSRYNAFIQGIQVRDVNTFLRSNSLQSVYVAGFNHGNLDDPFGMDAAGSHAHNIATDFRSPGTSASAPGTDAQAPGTSTAGSTALDIRPNSVGVLILMRVV